MTSWTPPCRQGYPGGDWQTYDAPIAWPADEYDLTKLAAGYFRDGLHLPRQGYYHAKEDLVALEDGARTLRSPLEC